jgi:hypothetical protein
MAVHALSAVMMVKVKSTTAADNWTSCNPAQDWLNQFVSHSACKAAEMNIFGNNQEDIDSERKGAPGTSPTAVNIQLTQSMPPSQSGVGTRAETQELINKCL